MSAARSPLARATLAAGIAFAFLGFVALGTWQLYRMQWKHALIERVNQRVHAAAVPAPGRAQWSAIISANAEYRHVRISGLLLLDRSTLVHASTEYGPGYWVMTPLRTSDGDIVLVNRGFVPAARPEAGERPATITGLLRMTEPRGGFLRHNDATSNRWYSRDVQAIAAARGLGPVAPYFIDADAGSTPDQPIGGLTVVAFHDNHLVYALTWYALALTIVIGIWQIKRTNRRTGTA